MDYKDSTKKLVSAASKMIVKGRKATEAKNRLKRIEKELDREAIQDTKGKIKPDED